MSKLYHKIALNEIGRRGSLQIVPPFLIKANRDRLPLVVLLRNDITRFAHSGIVRKFALQIKLTVLLYSPPKLAKRISLGVNRISLRSNITRRRRI